MSVLEERKQGKNRYFVEEVFIGGCSWGFVVYAKDLQSLKAVLEDSGGTKRTVHEGDIDSHPTVKRMGREIDECDLDDPMGALYCRLKPSVCSNLPPVYFAERKEWIWSEADGEQGVYVTKKPYIVISTDNKDSGVSFVAYARTKEDLEDAVYEEPVYGKGVDKKQVIGGDINNHRIVIEGGRELCVEDLDDPRGLLYMTMGPGARP